MYLVKKCPSSLNVNVLTDDELLIPWSIEFQSLTPQYIIDL